MDHASWLLGDAGWQVYRLFNQIAAQIQKANMEDAMTTDPRVPFSVSLHKSAADKIERYVAKIVRAEKVKRGAVIERMLLESIKKED